MGCGGNEQSLEASSPTGGKKLKPVGGSSWEHTLVRKAKIILRPSTIPSDRGQPSGGQPPSRRLQGGWMPHPGLAGFIERISCPLLMPLA